MGKELSVLGYDGKGLTLNGERIKGIHRVDFTREDNEFGEKVGYLNLIVEVDYSKLVGGVETRDGWLFPDN